MKKSKKLRLLLVVFLIIIFNQLIFSQQSYVLNNCYEKYSQEFYSKLLNVSGGKIYSFENTTLINADSVRVLTIKYNNGEFPDIAVFRNLEALFVQGNFDSIPTKVFENVNVKELEIVSFRSLKLDDKAIKQNITSLSNLIELGFTNIKFDNFPDVVWSLKKLETLRLNQCKINSFPNTANELSHLKKIEINQSTINKIDLKLFSNLVALSVLNSNISDVNMMLTNHEYLEFLAISNIKIKQKTIDLISNYKRLECLKLFEGNLKKFPDKFSNLSNLKLLILNGNKLSKFPNNIGLLKSLEEIYLDWNVFNKDVKYYKKIQKEYPTIRIVFL